MEKVEERDAGSLKALSGQMSQNAGRRLKGKTNPPGVQRLMGKRESGVLARSAVFGVAGERVADVRHLRADLVGPAGDKGTFKQGKPAAAFKYAVAQFGGQGARLRAVEDFDLLFLRIAADKVTQRAGSR